jgi:hypothetical protein
MSGKCQLGKAFCTDSVLNGHSGVIKHAVDSGVSSSVGLMTESQNHSSGLSGTPGALKQLHGNSRPDAIPIAGDKVHLYAHTIGLLLVVVIQDEATWLASLFPPTFPLLHRPLSTHSSSFH